jgi:hypothetical protein
VIGKTRGRNMKKRYPTVYRSGESMIMNGDGAREMKKKKKVLRVQMAWNRIMGWETWGSIR